MAGALPISTAHAASQTQQANKPGHGNGALTSPSQADNDKRDPASGKLNEAKDPQNTQHASSSDRTADNKDHDKDKHGKTFPAVFHSMLQDANGDVSGTVQKLLAEQANSDDKKAKATETQAAAAIGVPMFAAEKGKALPQLNFSGYVGVADGKGATALALQGDQHRLVSSQAVNGKDLPEALLKAQEQLAHNQLQTGVTANGQNSFSAAMNKEQAQGLNLGHQFMTDNVSLPQAQTAMASSNVHNILAQDMNGLAAASAARSADNALQQINVPVQQPQWAQQLGDRVHWMLGQGLHQAAIHLNPPELGALDVHIQMHGDQANVNFSSPHAVVRHALDAAMPRLREMMNETGLMLGDVNVSGQALSQQQSRDPQSQQGRAAREVSAIGGIDDTTGPSAGASIRHLSANGMLDVYA